MDVARRAVACSGRRWMPGMLVQTKRPDGHQMRLEDPDGDLSDAWSEGGSRLSMP